MLYFIQVLVLDTITRTYTEILNSIALASNIIMPQSKRCVILQLKGDSRANMILRGGVTYAGGNARKSRVLQTFSAFVAAVQLIDGFCKQRQLSECFL